MFGTITRLVGDLKGLGTLGGFVGLVQAIHDAGVPGEQPESVQHGLPYSESGL